MQRCSGSCVQVSSATSTEAAGQGNAAAPRKTPWKALAVAALATAVLPLLSRMAATLQQRLRASEIRDQQLGVAPMQATAVPPLLCRTACSA